MTAHVASASAQSAQWLRTRLLVEQAQALGCPVQQALQGTRIQPEMLATLSHPLAIPDQIRIMINTARALPNEPLGLLWGEKLDVFSRDRLGMWLGVHATLGEALNSALQYQGLLGSPVRGESVLTETEYLLTLHYPPNTRPNSSLIRLHNESLLSGLLLTFQQLVQQPITPLAMHFCHESPVYLEHYQRIFGCPITFSAEHSALVLKRSDLDAPIFSHNPSVQRVYNEEVEKEFREFVAEQSLPEQVKTHLSQLPENGQSAALVAAAIGISERTLRRRLEQEKTNFRHLQQQVLTERAREILQRPGITVQDAATELGYADASNFRRALKRIAGVTPAQLRP